MSDYRTLQRWIEEGENAQLDFKTTINSPSKIAKSLVAFANSRGGKIVVGIEDKGFFIGVDVEGEKYELKKAAKEFCTPELELTFEKLQHQGKFALVAEVAESKTKPHYAINKKKTGQQLYIRVADECIVPSLSIKKMLENGELNFIYRTADYQRTKNDLLQYLRLNSTIDVAKFAEWQRLKEQNAHRMLVDYMLEGHLKNTNIQATEFRLA